MGRSVHLAAVVLSGAALAFVASAAPSPASARAGLRAPAPAAASGHLYVADPKAGTVYRFPLGADGLPSKQSDAQLHGGLTSPFGLAFDRRGYLYVSDETVSKVNVYAPNATGNAQPIRQISLGSDWVGFVAVDRVGDVFVDDLNTNSINVYPPGSHGRAKPMRTIALWGQANPIRDMLIDSMGRLYVMSYAPPVYVFDAPIQQSNKASQLFYPQGGYEYTFGAAMALDEANAQIYIEFLQKDSSPPYAADDFAVRRLGASATILDRAIFTKDCRGPQGEPGTDVAAAIGGSYLMFSCSDRNVGVLVYRADKFGNQAVVETIGHSFFKSNADVKIGP